MKSSVYMRRWLQPLRPCMAKKFRLSPRLYFSYGQFLVYDRDVKAPGCRWTDEHTSQGFARRESTVCFRTLLEFGYADVSYCEGPFQPEVEYERVIAVPFFVSSGTVVIDGPDEVSVGRTFTLPAGNYRLVAGSARR
jgi:hypothetical protein